jgi:transposase
MMNLLALGIDISKKKFDIAIKINGKYKTKVFSNTREGFDKLEQWLKRYGIDQTHACLEATGIYGEPLALYLHEHGYQVSVINPSQIKGFAQSQLRRNKTDKADSHLIEQFCEALNPPIWQPVSLAFRQLSDYLKRLETLQENYQREKNRLETLFTEDIINSVRRILKMLEDEIKNIKKQMYDHVNMHPELRECCDLLTTIPGIGKETALKAIAILQDVNRFKSGKQVEAFAGLNPRRHESGSSIRKRAVISKIGHAGLRKALYFPAIVAKEYNPVIKNFCERLEKSGKEKMVIICAAMRKLLRIIFGVLKSKKPFAVTY